MMDVRPALVVQSCMGVATQRNGVDEGKCSGLSWEKKQEKEGGKESGPTGSVRRRRSRF